MSFSLLSRGWVLSGSALLLVLALAACSDQQKQGPGGDMKVPVNVVQVQPQRVEIAAELTGRVDAIKEAEIRARVTGIVESISFEQGSDVNAGDLLFTIDPAPYAAAREKAQAELSRAQADAQSARMLAQRYSRLIKTRAVSQQEYDNARAAAAQAEAQIAAAKAALSSADIDLGYTKVTSPISGRIGESFVTEGALVSATQATLLATVQQLDPVYVDLNRSTSELAALRRALASGQLQQLSPDSARALIMLDDGSSYEHPGKLLFSGVSVDPSTGTVRLRSVFPNPESILLPGMYARVRLPQGVDEKALMVPQQALQRTADGTSSLVVVKEGVAKPVPVTTGNVINGYYLITSGLEPGDVVVVAGFQKIRPGAPVEPIPWQPEGQSQSQNPPADSPEASASSADANTPDTGSAASAQTSGQE